MWESLWEQNRGNHYSSPASGSWIRSGASHRDGDPKWRKIHCGTRRICWCHSGDITNHELALEETHLPTEAVESGAVENQGLRRIYQGWPNQEKKKKITHSQNRILSGSTFLLPSCFLFFFQVVMVRNKKGCDLVFVLVGFSSKKVHHFLRSFPCPSHMKATRNLGITHI